MYSLRHSPLKAALVVRAAIDSAMHTATHNDNLFTIVTVHLFVSQTPQIRRQIFC